MVGDASPCRPTQERKNLTAEPGDVGEHQGGIAGAFDHQQQPAHPGGTDAVGQPPHAYLRWADRVEVQQVPHVPMQVATRTRRAVEA